MFFKRPGGQMQFTRKGEAVPAGRAALQELQRWVAANPGLDHSVASLANAWSSARGICQAVPREVGVTPATWVEEARVNAARRLLDLAVKPRSRSRSIVDSRDADTLRRAFNRHVGVTPAEYRKRFAQIHVESSSASTEPAPWRSRMGRRGPPSGVCGTYGYPLAFPTFGPK